MKTPKFLLSLKPKYVQAPVGWWQDDKRHEQPPGSYLDPSLRRSPDGRETNGRTAAQPSAKAASGLSARRAKRALR